MSESLNLINDVMSGDDDIQQSISSENSDGDSTIMSQDDAVLSSLLCESENIVRSFSNLPILQNNVVDDRKFERKSWENFLSPKSRFPTSNFLPKCKGTLKYGKGETEFSVRSNSMNMYPMEIQTFSDTATLIQTLQSELTKRTKELHNTENEYFNLKASHENMSNRFDMMNTDLSNLRIQVSSKDKQLRQMKQKINGLENNTTLTKGEYEKIHLELDNAKENLADAKKNFEEKLEISSQEVKKREDVIEQLRTELSQTARSVHKSSESDTLLKEKVLSLEKTIKQKEQQIQSFQRERNELERINTNLLEETENNLKQKGIMENLMEENELLKEQLHNVEQKSESLNETLHNSKKFYDDFKESSDKIMKEHLNKIEKLKQEYKELETKHRECMSKMKLQGDKYQNLVKEMTERKENDIQKIDQEKRVYRLTLENAELTKKLETLQVELVEASITETNLTKSIKNENDSKQHYIEQLSQETIHLNRVIDDLKEKIRVKDSSVENLNEQMVKLQIAKEEETKAFRNLEDQLYSSNYKTKLLENEIREKVHEIEIAEIELKNTKIQNDNLLDENRKIKNENKDLERSLKRQEDNRIQEIHELEDQLIAARSDITKLNFINNNEKEASQRAACENERLLKEINGIRIKLSECSEEMDDKRTSLDESIEKEKRLQNHNQYLEGELAIIKLALEDSNEELERMKNCWSSREDVLESCRNETRKQQENNVNLVQKIEQRDELLQRLTTETAKMKQKYQEKNTENTKLKRENDLLKKSVIDSENSSKDLQQKFESKVKKKEMAIEQLKQQLISSQNQYSQCYETLLKKEEHFNRLQALEKEQGLKVSQTQKEISRLQAEYDEMDGEIQMVRAKHRACQEELNHRDEQMMEIKNELLQNQQDFAELQSEKLLCQNEIDRWKEKYMDIQAQFQKQISETESLEDKLSEQDQLIDEIRGKLQVSLQKIENHERTIDQLKIDINMSKSTNSERYNHFQTIITSLKGEIENKNQEIKLIEERCANIKSQMLKLKEEKEIFHQNSLSLKNEADILQEKLRNKETECQHWMQQTQNAQYRNEEMKLSLENLSKEVSMTKQQTEVKETKLQSNAGTIKKLREENNQNYKNLLDYKSQLESSIRDRDEMTRLYNESSIKLRQFEQCMKEMNEELSTAQVDISSHINVISKLESELSHLTSNCSHKQSIIEEMECRIAKLKSTHATYKNHFKTSEEDVENLNGLLLKQTKRSAELETNFSIIQCERERAIEERDKMEGKIMQLRQELEIEKMKRNEEFEKTVAEKEEKIKSVENKVQKYQQELKKLRYQTKQSEHDLSIAHKTVDDLQNQLDMKQEQLAMIIKKCESTEDLLDRRTEEINQLELKFVSIENEARIYRSQKEKEWDKSPAMHKEIENLQLEIKEKNNKILEITNESTKFQTKCASLESQLEKTEKKMLRYESECKSLQTSLVENNKDIVDLRSQQCTQADILERTKSQYEKFFNDFNLLKEENRKEKKQNSQLKAETENLQVQLHGRIEHQKLLDEQIEAQEGLILDLQREIIGERKKSENFQRNEYEKKKTIENIETETESLSQTKYDLQLKLKEKERQLSVFQIESESSSQKNRQLTEMIMEKDNKSKILEKRLHSLQNEIDRLNENIKELEEIRNPIDTDSDRTDPMLNLRFSLEISEKQVHNLRSQLFQMQEENSKINLKFQRQEEEIQKTKIENEKLKLKTIETSSVKEKTNLSDNREIQSLREEIESLQRIIKRYKYELEEKDQLLLKGNDESMKNVTQKLIRYQSNEIANESKMEELKGELKYQTDQLSILSCKYEKLVCENDLKENELREMRDTQDILRKENCQITDKFAAWIQDQKLATDKLADKIRNQNKLIQELRKEKNHVEKENAKLYHDVQEIENRERNVDWADEEQIKNLDAKLREKGDIIKDLEKQIETQNREIVYLKEQIICQNKRPVINGDESCLYLKSRKIPSEGSLNSKERDLISFDRPYWIKRVGQLSEELEKTKEYWSNRLKEMSRNQESSTLTDETVSTESI